MMTDAELEDVGNKVASLLDSRRKALRKRLIALVCLYIVAVVILFVGASL
jgi:hypothetical protein